MGVISTIPKMVGLLLGCPHHYIPFVIIHNNTGNDSEHYDDIRYKEQSWGNTVDLYNCDFVVDPCVRQSLVSWLVSCQPSEERGIYPPVSSNMANDKSPNKMEVYSWENH